MKKYDWKNEYNPIRRTAKRLLSGEPNSSYAGIEHKCHQCNKPCRGDRHGFFCAFFPTQKTYIAEEIQYQQQNVHGDHAGWIGRSHLLAQQNHRRSQWRQKKRLSFPEAAFIRFVLHHYAPSRSDYFLYTLYN